MSDEMKRELNGVKLRLDKVESRLDGVESRLDGVESRLGQVEESNRTIARHVVSLDAKIDGAVDTLTEEIRAVSRHFGTILERAVAETAESRKQRLLIDRSFADHRSMLENHEVRLYRLEDVGGLHEAR